MEQTIVIGVHQFIGFHLANELLEKGNIVFGIDYHPQKENHDMDLYIGRNANYSLHTFDQIKEINVTEQTIVFIDWYDIQETNSERGDELTAVLQHWEEEPDDKKPVVIVFCPIVLGEWQRVSQERIIYLPTIYGPWQPVTMSFAAAINQVGETDLNRALKNEYRHDAIYIDDVLKALPELLKEDHPSIILESMNENQWIACAEEINKPELKKTLTIADKRVINDKAVYHKVLNSVTPRQGITLQIEHYEKMKRLSMSD